MSKTPRKPGEPNRPATLRPETGTALAAPRQRLIAAIAATMARQAARTGVGEAEPDADLLAQCALVNQGIVGPLVITEEDWERALLRTMSLAPLTLSGLRAKVEIALSIIGLPPEPGDEVDHIDRVVLYQTLAEVLALINDAQATDQHSVQPQQ